MFGVFYVDIHRQPPFPRMRGISGLAIYVKIKEIIPDQHHHRIFVVNVTVYALLLVKNVPGAIVIAQHIVVVDLKPFLSFES